MLSAAFRFLSPLPDPIFRSALQVLSIKPLRQPSGILDSVQESPEVALQQSQKTQQLVPRSCAGSRTGFQMLSSCISRLRVLQRQLRASLIQISIPGSPILASLIQAASASQKQHPSASKQLNLITLSHQSSHLLAATLAEP
jgi:hypothetical protein